MTALLARPAHANRAARLMLNAGDELLACQQELLSIRREGPRRTRASGAKLMLSLCRINRTLHRTAAALLREARA